MPVISSARSLFRIRSEISRSRNRSALRKLLRRSMQVENLEGRRLLTVTPDLLSVSQHLSGHIATSQTESNPTLLFRSETPEREPLALPTPEPLWNGDELTASGSGPSSSTYYGGSSSSSSSSSSGGPPVISNVGLVNDTGVSQSDKVTSDPRVTGSIDGAFWSYGTANIEFDHNADGSADGVVVPTSQGAPFEYDPRTSDPSISSLTGPFTLQYRAMEYDYYGNLTYQGQWQPFTMTLEDDAASEISIIDDNSQNLQSGVSVVDLGTTDLSQTVTREFTIYNLGSGELSLDVPSLDIPAGFSLGTIPSDTVAPFSQTSFSIVASATAAGQFSGTFSLPTNDSDEDPFAFTLQVNVAGPSPEIEISDAASNEIVDGSGAIDYGTTHVGSPLTQNFTISNTGDATLDIAPNSLSLPSGFELVGNFPGSVAAGSSASFAIRLTGVTEGNYVGDLVFANNDADEGTFSFELSGLVNPNPSSPAVTSLALSSNDGVSPSDRISSDPTLSGTVVGDFAEGFVTLEFDHHNSGAANGSVDVASSGASFTYDPRASDPSLVGYSGWLPIRYRVIHKNVSGGLISSGPWQEFKVIIDRDAAAGSIAIEDFGLVRDTGGSASDRVTITPIVKGAITGVFGGGSARVEFARAGSTTPSGNVVVSSSGGTFEYDPRLTDGGLSGFVGDATIRYRLVQLDNTEAVAAESDWIDYAINLEEAPAGSFTVSGLDLAIDDGSSNTDNVTTDPTLIGSVVYSNNSNPNPPSPSNAVIQYDVDDDGSIDGTAIADTNGEFKFRPNGVSYQLQTIRARVLEWDPEYATYLVGPWASTAVHLIPPPSPEINDLKLMVDNGLSDTDSITSNPSVSGRVALEDTGIGGAQVVFDYEGDSSHDGSAFTDHEGNFFFRPRGLTPGTVTLKAKSLYWDEIIGAHVYSAETTVTFTYQPPAMPSIEWMDLAVDDGENPLDRQTTSSTIIGQLKTTSIRNSVFLEFDNDEDGVADGYSTSDSFGTFSYDPIGIAAGSVNIAARTKQWNDDASQWQFSPWTNLGFTLIAKPSITLEVDSIGLRRDTGTDDSDLVTSEGTIVGSVAGTAHVGSQLIDIDVDGDGLVDGQALTDKDGKFTYVHVGLGNGIHTLRARTRFWDHTSSTGNLGDWQSISFTLAEDPNLPPEVSSIVLHSDSGVSSTDNATENPLLVGTLSNAEGFDGVILEFDEDGNGSIDGHTYADADGTFYLLPSLTNYGSKTVKVRAKEYNTATDTLQYSQWKSITFTYEDQADAAPTLHNVQWVSAADRDSNPRITGAIRDDQAIGAVGIEIDDDGDQVADFVIATDWFGTFEFEPPTAAFGTLNYSIRTKESSDDGSTAVGPWQTFTFNNLAPPTNSPPTVSDLVLANDTGASDDDRVTSDLLLNGTISDDASAAGLLVQYDIDGDGIPDGSTITDAEGAFAFRPRGLALGTHSIQVRAKEYTLHDGIAYGPWDSIDVTLETSRESRIDTLVLTDDTGASNSDGATANAALSGTIAGDQKANVLVFFDHDKDGIPDGNTTSNHVGNFTYTPADLSGGVTRINAWIARGGSTGDANSNSIRFILSDTPDDSETQDKVAELSAFDATWQSAQGSFEASISAARTAAAASFNSAEIAYNNEVDAATAVYQTAVAGADSAYAAAIEAAEADYAAAIDTARTQFETELANYSDSSTTTLPIFSWPAPPPTDKFVVPDDSSQPQVPELLGVHDLPYYVTATDASYSGAVQNAVAAAQQAQQETTGTYNAAISTANTAESDAVQAAHDEYASEVAMARAEQSDALNEPHPTIDLAAAALAYATTVQNAHDAYFAAKQSADQAWQAAQEFWESYDWDGSFGQLPQEGTWLYYKLEYQWYTMEQNRTQRDREKGLAAAEVTYITTLANAEHSLNSALSAATHTLQNAQAEYDHWTKQQSNAAEAVFRTKQADAIRKRQKESADARYTKSVAAINAAYDAAVAGLNTANALGTAALAAGQDHANAVHSFLGTAATEAAQVEVTKDSDLETLLQPLRDAHSLLEAQTRKSSALRLATEAKDAAYAQADALHAGTIREINARKALLDAENDASKARAIEDNAAGKAKSDKDSEAGLDHQVDTIEAEKTRVDVYWGIVLPFADTDAELNGIAQANSELGLPEDISNTIALYNNTAASQTATLSPWTGKKKAIADIDKALTHDLENFKNEHDKKLNASLQVYRDAVAEAVDTHDTETIDANADRSSNLADAAAVYLAAVSSEQQTVADIVLPSEQNLNDQAATFTKQILVAKAAARRDAEIESADDQAAHVANWHSTLNSFWSDLKNDEAQADKSNATTQANAGFSLTDQSAGAMLSLATTVNALSTGLQLGEIGAWVGHATTTIGAMAGYTNNSANSTSDTGDKVTDKTEGFDKSVNIADKARSDTYSDNRKTHAKAFASAKAQYIKSEADAVNAYWVAVHEANRAYGVAIAGVTDSAVIAAAAATRTNSLSSAATNKATALDAAGLARRTSEGDAIKTKTIADAQAQATWVASAGSAYSGWVSGVGTETNEYASEMKGHGVGFTSTTADSAAGANETVAEETHDFNTGSASGTEGLNNALAGFTASFNSNVASAASSANSDKTAARGDYEVALHQAHQSERSAANVALGSRLSEYQLDLADVELIRAQAYASANNDLVGKYGSANASLTAALNTADINLVSSLSSADKQGTINFSDAGKSRVITFGDAGADLTTDGATADLELGRALTAVGVTFSTDIAGAATLYANSVEDANVDLAEASGEAVKLLHIGQNSAAAQAAAEAIMTPAQAAYDGAVKTAGITLAGDVGDAGITSANGSGTANVAHTSSWGGAVSNYTTTTNNGETTYTNATNGALAGWVAATVAAENERASAIVGAFQAYVGSIGQAEVDWQQDIGDADEEYAAGVAQAEVDYHFEPTYTPTKCDEYIARGAEELCYRISATAPTSSGTAAGVARHAYLGDVAPAKVAEARAKAEAETDRNVAERQAEKARDDALAAADKQFVDSLAAPTAAEANNSVGQGNDFASDAVGNVNDFLEGVVSSNGSHATAHTSSDKTHDVDVAKALKTYLQALAALDEGDDDSEIEEEFDDKKAEAIRDDKIREAKADFDRAETHIKKAHKFVTDMAGDGKDLSVAVAGIERAFVTAVAPLIARWNNAYAAADAGQRSDNVTADGSFDSATTAADGDYRSADFAAQSSALASMQSSAPSDYLASMANLASQRESWWNARQTDELASTTGRNAANANYVSATNAASLDDPATGNSAAQRINAAGVTYANTTSAAFELFNNEVAAHLKTYVDTVAGAGKTYGLAKAGAEKSKKIAIAQANYSKATSEGFDYASAIASANSEYSDIVGPAAEEYELAKKNAAETRTNNDASSQKKVDDAVAAAEKIYADAVADARADESDEVADAAEAHDNALAGLDSAADSAAASSWAAQLADPASATNDPWHGLAADIAGAQAGRQSATGSAASALASSRAAAMQSLEADLAGAFVDNVADTSAARETYAAARGTASVAFASQTGGNANAPTGLTFREEPLILEEIEISRDLPADPQKHGVVVSPGMLAFARAEPELFLAFTRRHGVAAANKLSLLLASGWAVETGDYYLTWYSADQKNHMIYIDRESLTLEEKTDALESIVNKLYAEKRYDLSKVDGILRAGDGKNWRGVTTHKAYREGTQIAYELIRDTAIDAGVEFITAGAGSFVVGASRFDDLAKSLSKLEDVAPNSAGPSAKTVHDVFTNKVRPGAKERVFQTPWSSGKGLGSRKFDDFDDLTGTGFEGNTTPWSKMTQEQLSRKLDQVGSDYALLKTNPDVKRIIWFGTEELPTTGLGAQLREALQKAGIEYWVVKP